MGDPRGSRLRERVLHGTSPLLLLGAPNALFARMLEDAGAEAAYVSGAGVSNSFLGVPDIGLLTMSELAVHVEAMRNAVDLPLIVDADTGFGNSLNVLRTVRTLERAGANAIQLEDQVTPKRCGHFEGKETISAAEMVGKIQAAVDARNDESTLIIARTDARAEFGLGEACDRANAYLRAGADVAFVEAPENLDEVRALPGLVEGPLLLNLVEGGKTPLLGLKEIGEIGFSIVLYANTALRAAMAAAQQAIKTVLHDGSVEATQEQTMSWSERQRLVQKDLYDELARRYGEQISAVK